VFLINLNGNNDQVCKLAWTDSGNFLSKRGDETSHASALTRGASRLNFNISPWIQLDAIPMQVGIMHEHMQRDSSWLDNAAGKSHRDPRYGVTVFPSLSSVLHDFAQLFPIWLGNKSCRVVMRSLCSSELFCLDHRTSKSIKSSFLPHLSSCPWFLLYRIIRCQFCAILFIDANLPLSLSLCFLSLRVLTRKI